MDLDNEFPRLRDKASEWKSLIENVLNKYFTKAQPSIISPQLKVRCQISPRNIFDNTKYYVDKTNSFIHFTSIEGLIAILRYGFLRLSSLDKMEDKKELEYGRSVFADFKSDTNQEEIFSLSLCEYSEELILAPYMWENYAKNQTGACIKLKIQNAEYNDHFMGKILYGDENRKILSELKKDLIIFLENHNDLKDYVVYFLRWLYCFHKEQNYIDENEVRLLATARKECNWIYEEKFIHKLIYQDLHNDHFDWYYKLYLINSKLNNNEYKSIYPKISLEEIILGYNNPSNHSDLEYLKKLIKENLEDNIQIKKIKGSLIEQ